MSNLYLEHHGILGMKWGVRRYQNKDGSLTPAGKKRYKSTEEELKAREKVIKNAERAKAKVDKLNAKKAELDAREEALKSGKKKVEPPKPKTMKDMTDDELRAQTNRMQLEKQYIDAQKNLAAANPRQMSAGEKFIKSLKDDVLIPAAKNAGKEYVEKVMKDKLGLNKKDVDPIKKLESQYKKLELETKIKDLEKAGTLKETKEVNWDNRLKEQTYWKNEADEKERRKRREQGDD